MFVLLSDCFGDLQALLTSLRLLRARGHEVMVIHTLAPEELEFDFRHFSAFQSLEDDTRLQSYEAPLTDVLEFLQAQHDMTIQLDEPRLRAAPDVEQRARREGERGDDLPLAAAEQTRPGERYGRQRVSAASLERHASRMPARARASQIGVRS